MSPLRLLVPCALALTAAQGDVGMFVKEQHTGAFADMVQAELGDAKTTDITNAFSGLLAVKDSKELVCPCLRLFCCLASLFYHC